eukprot:3719559-Pleurochrysis_carterae.AAC.3
MRSHLHSSTSLCLRDGLHPHVGSSAARVHVQLPPAVPVPFSLHARVGSFLFASVLPPARSSAPIMPYVRFSVHAPPLVCSLPTLRAHFLALDWLALAVPFVGHPPTFAPLPAHIPPPACVRWLWCSRHITSVTRPPAPVLRLVRILQHTFR